jgi:uracil-DNA glycosylase family 4
MTMLRGSTHGALCAECPFATNGAAQHPVTSEYPEDPRWILVGESPGRTEVQLNRPFQGSQQLIEKMLSKIGRRRDELVLTTAALCAAPMGATEHDRELAARACKPRLQQELAQWPGMPVLTLGAVAARALIPKAVLDAIDPPNVPKSKKRGQKERQKAEAKALLKATKADAKAVKQREDAIVKIAKARLKVLDEHQRKLLIAEAVRPAAGTTRPRKKPTRAWTDHEMERYLPQLTKKAAADAITQYQLDQLQLALQIKHEEANPKPVKPPKHKTVKITDIMSTCFDVDVDGTGITRPLIPTIHPGSLLRGGGATIGGTHTPDLAFINLYYDASKADALSQGKDVRLKVNVETEIADPERCGQLVRDALDRALVEGELSIDLETYVDDIDRHHALMAYMARIRTIGLATNDKSISVMWGQIPSWALSYLQLVLAHLGVTKTFHNGIYDRTVLAANGFTVEGPWEDTLLGHHAAFPGCAHRLQSVTSQFFAVSPWKSEFRNAEETPEGLTKYNALDTGATHALRPAMTLWIKRTKTEKIYALDKKMAEIASKMHLAGMPVSRDENSELLKTFSHNVVESRRAVEAVAEDPKLRDEIFHWLALQQAQKARLKDPNEWTKSDGTVVTGIEARYEHRMAQLREDGPAWKWKVSANKHIAALLQALGVALVQQTASGQISTKKDVLEGLVHVPVVRDILTFRENDKLLSTFVWQIFDRFDSGGNRIQCGYADDNDRIHPIWTVHKITGRWASSEPVVSNVPKDKFRRLADGTIKIIRPNLRKQIVAPPGRIFVGFDFAQLEARIIALISGDPFLCQVFADGKDIHRECARVIFAGFDQMPEKDQKKAREETKPLEYGAFYGGAPETLWKQMLKEGRNVKLVDIARAVATLMNKMAGVVAWQRNTVAQASQPPYEVRDFLLGRRRTFPLGQVEATEAMNFGVQAAGAAIMNTGMAIMDDALGAFKEAFAIAQIHDAAVFECWEDDAPRLAETVTRCFTQAYERDGRMVPFPVETKIAKSWAGV